MICSCKRLTLCRVIIILSYSLLVDLADNVLLMMIYNPCFFNGYSPHDMLASPGEVLVILCEFYYSNLKGYGVRN